MDVDDAAGLELDDLGVGDPAPGPERGDAEPAGRGQAPLQGDGEPAPQLGGVELPEHVADVVVAVPAQRLPEHPVAVALPSAAEQRSAVRAERLVPPGPARPLGAQSVYRSEGRRGERRERRRVVRDGLGGVLAAGEAADQQVPGVALVLVRAGRAHRGAPVLAPPVGDPVQLVRRRVGPDLFAGPGFDAGRGPDEPDGSGAAPGPGLGVGDRDAGDGLPTGLLGHAAPSSSASRIRSLGSGAG